MTDAKMEQAGVNVFIGALGATLSEFKRLPLDDRDCQWILERLQRTLHDPSLPCLSEIEPTLRLLSQRLDLSIRWWDQHPHLDRQ